MNPRLRNIVLGGGIPLWVPRLENGQPYYLYADHILGHYWFAGRRQESEAAWLGAMGASGSWLDFVAPWTSTSFSGFIEGVLPTVNGTNALAIQADDGTENNRIYLRRNTSNQVAFQVITGGSFQGATAPSGFFSPTISFRTAFSVAANEIYHTVYGAGASFSTSDTSLTLPSSVSYLRMGSNSGGTDVWDGEIWKIGLALTTSSSSTVATKSIPDKQIWGAGDSWMIGNTVPYGIGYGVKTQQKVFYTEKSVGGSTLADQVTVVSGATSLQPYALIHCDGDPNGYDAVTANDVARYQSIYDSVSGRVVFILPSIRANQTTDENTAARALCTALKAAFSATQIVDTQSVAAALGDPVADATDIANGNIPSSLLQGDGTHPLQTLSFPLAQAAIAKLRSNGWL